HGEPHRPRHRRRPPRRPARPLRAPARRARAREARAVNGWQAFAAGIDPAHIPALCCALLLPILVVADRALYPARPRARLLGAGPDDRGAAWLLGISAAVPLGLPFGHHDDPRLIAGFLGSGALYALVARRAYAGRSWRLIAAPLILATLVAYVAVLATGG